MDCTHEQISQENKKCREIRKCFVCNLKKWLYISLLLIPAKMSLNIINFHVTIFSCLLMVLLHLSAVHHWPQPGGLAYCYDQSEGSCDHSGVDSLCHPSSWHILGGGPPSQLIFLSATLRLQPPRRGPHGHRAAVINADVPPLVLGAQNHPAAQQSAAQRLLQEHRLTQQHQLHLSLCSQGTDEQVPRTHAVGLHPLLLAHSILDACTVWEVGTRTECVESITTKLS